MAQFRFPRSQGFFPKKMGGAGKGPGIRRSILFSGFLVSKETVVLRQWGRSKQKFGFIKRVDKFELPP